jgi:hypothetical protein
VTYRFDTVWNACTPALSEEIIAFWRSENALPAEDDPALRTGQTVVVARDMDGRIAGTCTAYLRVVPRLGQPMYYFRMFFSGGHRRRYSIIPMMKEAQKALSAHNSGLPVPESLGVVMEVENPNLRRHTNPTWPVGFNFIGYSPRGLPLYAYYFPGAKLLPPARRRNA